jgi:hypothetical protein
MELINMGDNEEKGHTEAAQILLPGSPWASSSQPYSMLFSAICLHPVLSDSVVKYSINPSFPIYSNLFNYNNDLKILM